MDFVYKLYGNTYAVHVTVALVGVATLNLALPAPPPLINNNKTHHALNVTSSSYKRTMLSGQGCQSKEAAIVLAVKRN